MKNSIRLLVCLLATCSALSACKRGFELEEVAPVDDESADQIFIGAIEGSSWRLLLLDEEDDERFTIQQREDPNSTSNQKSLNGNYSRDSDGWLTLEIASSLPSDIENQTIYGLQLANEAIVLFPFLNSSNEWLPLIEAGTCPSADYEGNMMLLNRPGDASRNSISWVASFTYDQSETNYIFNEGVALDTAFEMQMEFNQDSSTCGDGFDQRSGGDHYISNSATLLELDSATVNEDGYTRAFGIPKDEIGNFSDTDDADYIGMIRDFSEPDSVQRVSASCVNGVCEISAEDPATDYELRLTETEDSINFRNLNGIVTAEFDSTVGTTTTTTRAICIINTNYGASSVSTKIIACTAQAPTNQQRAIQVLLAVRD